MNFYDWITKKYLEWQADLGERRSASEFAEYIGMGQRTVSSWMQPNGSVPRSTKAINKLVSRFGEEVYQVLGMQSPQTVLLAEAPPWIRDWFASAISEANQQYRAVADSGRALSETEAISIICESMAKYGFSETSSDNVNPANEK